MNIDVQRVKNMEQANMMGDAIAADPAFFYKALMMSKEGGGLGEGKFPPPGQGAAAVIDETKPPVVVNCTGDQARKQGFRGSRDWARHPGHEFIDNGAKRYVGLAEESVWRNPFSLREWGSGLALGLYEHYVR